MSDGFTIGAAMAEPTIFQCPSCRETIDANAGSCRFCGATVDRESALKAARALAEINQACSDASNIRITALTIPVFFLVRYIPFFGWAGTIGFWCLLLFVPIWAGLWLFKYRSILTDDADFLRARKTVKWTGSIVGISFAFVGVMVLLVMMAVPGRL